MKFLLESNLSRLAKWLRFLGHDVKVLGGEINRRELARNQDRVFITTSKRWEDTLRKVGMRYLLVPRHDWELQLCMVLKHFGLKPELQLNRCAYCGTELTPVEKESVRDRVPPKAYGTAYDFTLCPKCGALFWKGTHYEGMVRMLESALKRC
ncbi:Mut7-C RNAse domain-containing protein [Hydrogenivirga sp.]